MTKKTLTIAAAVAVALALGGIGATSYVGRKTEEHYNGWLDRMLAELPFLKVEKRSYDRGLFGAESNLVLRFDLPEPPKPGSQDDEESEAAEDDDADEGRAAEGTLAAPASRPPRAIVLAMRDRIRHGPFPGSLAPAAARIASTVDLTTESADGVVSAPWTALTASSTLDFAQGYETTYVSPAGQWRFDEGRTSLSWAGLEGQSTGSLDNLASRFSSKSPGLSLAGTDKSGQPFELAIGEMRAEGQTGPSTSLLVAPGEIRSTLSSLRITGQSPQGEKSTLSINDVTGHYRTVRNGDLLELRNTVQGKGAFGDVRIDGFEMVEQYRNIHAPTFEGVLRRFFAGVARQGDAAPAVAYASMLEDLRALAPYDPSYEVEKLTLAIDGRKAEIAYRLALQGATREMLDDPMALMAAVSAGLQASIPRAWVETLAGQAGAAAPGVPDAGQLERLIAQGEQMGFLVVDDQLISTRVRFERGGLEVNGRTVFSMPARR